jgi:hypothetical protein
MGVWAPDCRVAVDELLAQADSEFIDPDRPVVDLYFEFCIM